MGCLLLVGSLALIGLAAPSAQALSGQDSQYIGYLRSIFGVDSSQASDAQLAQLLDAPQLGPSIRSDMDCAYLGEHALDGTGAEAALASALLGEINSVVSANLVIDPVILVVAPEAGFLVDLHEGLDEYRSLLSVYVKSVAYLDSDVDYRSLLSEYYGDEVQDGQTADEAQQSVSDLAGSLLDAVAHPRGLSVSQLFAQFEHSSECMRLVQDADERNGYADYIDGIVQAVTSYQAGSGLILIPIGSSSFRAVNTGDGALTDLTVQDGSGHTLGTLADLGPGKDAPLSLSSGTDADAFTIGFAVDGVPGLTTDYINVERGLFVGNALASLADAPPMTGSFDIDQGPFAAIGSPSSYSWAFSGGGSAPGVHVTHTFACPGDQTGTFTATGGGQTITRQASVYIPPPYEVEWTTPSGRYQVAPGVPLTFNADPSVANNSNLSVSWSFGDGGVASGASVTHTFASNAIENVTMSVAQKGSSCPALTQLHKVQVARSDQWVTLSGTIGDYTMDSSVAGYVLAGPVYVAKGRTLTIEPGTNVKFTGTVDGRGEMLVDGSLDVAGVAGAPAVFTSEYDDSAGGHCSCAPTGHTPATGDWYGIVPEHGGNVTLNGADVRYANWGVNIQESSATVAISDSTLTDDGTGFVATGVNAVTIDHTLFDNDDTGVRIDCFGCTYSPHVTDSTFSGGSLGAWITNGAAPVFDGSTFEGVKQDALLDSTAARTTFTHSTADDAGGYVELNEGPLPTGAVRLDSDLPYVLRGLVTVSTKTTLAVGPGTTLKFLSGGGNAGDFSLDLGELDVSGALVVSGTEAAPVLLTSPYDDTAGHCGCVKPGILPAAGDWYGIVVESGASATLDHADVRYAGDDVTLPGTGATVQIARSTLEDAGSGLYAKGANSVTVSGSSASHDGAGMQLDCSGCSYTAHVTDTSFNADTTGVRTSGNASAAIHASDFDAQDRWGVYNAGNATVDATGNWWGAASGPSPGGSGAAIVGNVAYLPYCTGVQCTDVSVTASQVAIEANGRSTTTLTATVRTPTGPVTGEHVSFASSDPAEQLGEVTDNGDGTYTTTLTSSQAVGSATVTATDRSLSPAANGSLTVTQAAPSVGVSVSPTSIAADGHASATATATVTGPAGPVGGEQVSFASSDPGEQVGAVTDNGDGTYTATITASHAAGFAAITATDDSVDPSVSASTELVQAALTDIAVSINPHPIIANGHATSTATVSVSAGGVAVSGEAISLASSDPGETIGPVNDNGDGTYTATITASKTVGTATITATDLSTDPHASATANLDQVAPNVAVELSHQSIVANGRATTTATVSVSAGGVAVSGEAISLASSDPGETIGPVNDNGDGTYTATITASKTVGTATITAIDNAVDPTASATATATQVPSTVNISLSPAVIAADSRSTATATATVTGPNGPVSGEQVSFASSDPGETVGPVVDNGDGTYTATITASKRVETATITGTDTSVDPATTATTTLTQETPRQTHLALSPKSIAANGRATSTATVTITARGKPLGGEHVTLMSSDPGEQVGPVTDNGDGTYTATITASKTVGTATITAADTTDGLNVVAAANLKQEAPKVAVVLSPKPIVANGRAITTATVTVSAAGALLSGEDIVLSSSDSGETIGPVTDNGDGTYTATITASKTVGTATITATDITASPVVSKAANLNQVAPTIAVTLSPASIAANGNSTTTVTAKLTAAQSPLSGENVTFASSDPGEQVGAVTDNGDGTYTATITASKRVETATITATDASVSPMVSKAAKLKQS